MWYNVFGDRMEKEHRITIKKICGHFKVVTKHRWKVFCLCCKVGIPIQGFMHDMSKYLPVEFLESARYFDDGKYSPIRNCKKEKGYSLAWIHHINHNKHHYEYWYDYDTMIPSPIMPFKYFLELICDSFAAGLTYQGKNWKQGYQLEYWNRVKDRAIMHPKMKECIEKVYVTEKEEGLKKILKRKKLKEIYDKYTK